MIVTPHLRDNIGLHCRSFTHHGAKVVCIYGYTPNDAYDATCLTATGTATCDPKSCMFRDTDGQTKTVDQLTLPKCWKGPKRVNN
ncbi:hypothetical protein O181_098417 [Austropuccinia psidii MF-1]|uniref:Uncharacterized protein n=1 Tax=Austropuccinia psidii MF-1 TaxID=1389203 RepID=A0A9Q3JAD0_9BASI|nr:hypothetical protein [Austropuccinia psidii MF-1]